VERIRQGESHAKVRDAMAFSIGVIGDGGVKREKPRYPENVAFIPGKWKLIPWSSKIPII
jgi:hypothetical protein